MNPKPVTAGKRFSGGEGFRRHSRPAHHEHTVITRHPRGWKVRMLRMDKNGGPTQPVRSLVQVARQIGPREFRRQQIFARVTGGHGDDCLRARPKSKSQSAIAFAWGTPQGDRLIGRRPRQLEVYGTTLRRRWMNLDVDFLCHDSFVADQLCVLHVEDCHVGFGFLREPAPELDANAAQTPKIVLLVGNSDVRPRPVKSTMIIVILRKVIG